MIKRAQNEQYPAQIIYITGFMRYYYDRVVFFNTFPDLKNKQFND